MSYIQKGTFQVFNFVLEEQREDYIEVDELIANAIAVLNKKGYQTKFSCSGHLFDSTLENVLVTDINTGEEIPGVTYHAKEDQCYICFCNRHDFDTLPPGFSHEVSIDECGQEYSFIESYINVDALRYVERLKAIVELNIDLLSWATTLEDKTADGGDNFALTYKKVEGVR